MATNIYGFAESICIMVFMGHSHPQSACRFAMVMASQFILMQARS